MIKGIFFDFDGVLAESVNIKTEAFYNLYIKYGVEIADKVVKHHELNAGMSRYKKFAYYHKKFLGKTLNKNEIQYLSESFSDLVVKNVINSDEVDGATYFLDKYYNSMDFWVVSATPNNEIKKIIYHRKMNKYFNSIWGSPSSKISIVKSIINNENININKTIFLGDGMADYEAAKSNKIDFYLRENSQNNILFKKLSNLNRFSNFYDLESKLIINE